MRARTPNQQKYCDTIAEHDLTFGIGPVGHGQDLPRGRLRPARPRVAPGDEDRPVPTDRRGGRKDRLPARRPDGEGEPYLRPLYDAFIALLGGERFRTWRDNDVIEIVPLAYMRGRTFEDAFLILDEAQNTTPSR